MSSPFKQWMDDCECQEFSCVFSSSFVLKLCQDLCVAVEYEGVVIAVS